MVVKGRVSTQRGENALMETHMGVAEGISTIGGYGGRVVLKGLTHIHSAAKPNVGGDKPPSHI